MSRRLGRTGLKVSVVGFGGYRVDDETPEHAEAMAQALRDGCNLIDTSTNYTDGGSERLVGRTVAAVPRDSLVVVSKVGYVQGQNLEIAVQREADGRPYPEMVKYQEGCWHCLHPDFIHEQVQRSLERTGLSYLDVYLLHNPEYFLSDAKKRGKTGDLKQLRDQFYDRVERAFGQLEKEVAAGTIRWYGVSSNTIGGAPDAIETTSLERIISIAGPRFGVLQCPLNLFESGPVQRGVLKLAKERDIGVLINRPLNAIVGGQMIRLADFPFESNGEQIAPQIDRLRALEEEFVKQVAPKIPTTPGGAKAADFFRWSSELSSPDLQAIPLEHWSQLENQMILPQVNYLLSQLNHHFASVNGHPWPAWRDRYWPALERLLRLIRNESAKRSQVISDRVAKKLDPFLPGGWKKESLSRKALAVVAHTEGVTCVLNGMRRPEYVTDALGVEKLPALDVDPKLYETFTLP